MTYQEAIDKYGSTRKAAKALGIPRTTLQRKLKKEKRDEAAIKSLEPVGESGQSGVRGLPPAPVGTFESECEKLGIDPSEATRAWLKTDVGTIQVDRKKSAKSMELSADFVAILDQARKHVVREAECRSADSMLVISICDSHVGKLAWAKEAGENYDPAIASAIYRQAVSDALTFFNPSRVKRIVMPVGHDILHVDNLRSETTSGTRVDSVDTRFAKIFDIAVAAVIAGIEDAVRVADVFVPVVSGNHDENCSVLLTKVVKQYFKDDPRVTVDDSEIGRKYLHWGCNLLCMTHRFTNWSTAPNVMATEAPVEWGLTTSREILTGHLHTRKATSYQSYYETHGVVVRVLPSLSATDAWHHKNGFIGNLRAAESHLYSEESGIIGSHLSKVRT